MTRRWVWEVLLLVALSITATGVYALAQLAVYGRVKW